VLLGLLGKPCNYSKLFFSERSATHKGSVYSECFEDLLLYSHPNLQMGFTIYVLLSLQLLFLRLLEMQSFMFDGADAKLSLPSPLSCWTTSRL
jgi:hypothetical protein